MTGRAHTVRVDQPVDLLEVAGGDGVLFAHGAAGLAGRGVAEVVEVERLDDDAVATVGARLAALAGDDEVGRPGTGPVAFVSLAFEPGRPARFVIPAEVVGIGDDGVRWRTTIGSPTTGSTQLAPDEPEPRPTQFSVSTSVDPKVWKTRVADAARRVADGDFDKVVLAREVVVTADQPIPRARLLARLRRRFPDCYTFSVGELVGASPELLVARHGDRVRSHPMAGTAPRGGDPSADARLAASLLASAKDRTEHQITIDMVLDTLLAYCSYVDSEPEPSVVGVANVQHLASLVDGRLSQPAASVLDLVRALHPTPAVAGRPLAPALDHIAAHEGIDRGGYAGAVGWVDAAGNGQFSVAVRSARLDGAVARLYAGVGIVADSDPVLELAETEAKFEAMLSSIVRP